MAAKMWTRWRVVGRSSLDKTVELFTKKKLSLRWIIFYLTKCHYLFGDITIITNSTTREYSDSSRCEPNAPLFRDCFWWSLEMRRFLGFCKAT